MVNNYKISKSMPPTTSKVTIAAANNMKRNNSYDSWGSLDKKIVAFKHQLTIKTNKIIKK